MFIKPTKDKQVPDPFRGGYLPEDGAEVDDNDIYWQRRLNDGDIEVVTASQRPPKQKNE